MATFPSYARVVYPDGDETPGALVERSNMERGVAKQRRFQTDPVITKSVTVIFNSVSDESAFRNWFYSSDGANAGAAWFDFRQPRTGTTVQARIVGGDIGALKMNVHRGSYSRTFNLEWVETLA